MAANANMKARYDAMGLTYTEGTKQITFPTQTLSVAQLHEVIRAGTTQGYDTTLVAGVLTLIKR